MRNPAPVNSAWRQRVRRAGAIVAAEFASWAAGGAPRPAVFEVDELAFPMVAAALRPGIVVLLNLVRDQLDRYGEVDAVERSWIGRFERSHRRRASSSAATTLASNPSRGHRG